MNNVVKQVAGVVAAVAIFALLAGVGYITQVGMSQTFGPGDPPRENRRVDRGNRAYANTGTERIPIPEDESVWEDYDDESLDYEPRLGNRPGNMDVVAKTGEFWQAMYEVEPRYVDLAFPLNWNGRRYESEKGLADLS